MLCSTLASLSLFVLTFRRCGTETDQESVLWAFIRPDGIINWVGYSSSSSLLIDRRKVTKVCLVVWAALGIELPTYPLRGIKPIRSFVSFY